MQKANTSEFLAAELDYKTEHSKLIDYTKHLKSLINQNPQDKILPEFLKIAKINLKILKILQNENIPEHKA